MVSPERQLIWRLLKSAWIHKLRYNILAECIRRRVVTAPHVVPGQHDHRLKLRKYIHKLPSVPACIIIIHSSRPPGSGITRY